MQRVLADHEWPLFDVAATRRIEQQAASMLPPHALMDRAGLATARLALAIAPHARSVWIACGRGNNGGDGLEAAVHLAQWGKAVTVTLAGSPERLPPDAAAALARFRGAGLAISSMPPQDWDLCVDALLGIGVTRPLDGAIADAARTINAAARTVLSVDIPSGLDADTGQGASVSATHTLTLLACKPGLFTGRGRDATGACWFDDLGVQPAVAPTALLGGRPPSTDRPHASHKGSFGDVAVIGGAPGMAGAAVLAASAALHAGAGRTYLCALDPAAAPLVAGQPELMTRDWRALPLQGMSVACGCGGGTAITAALPDILSRTRDLVLDADALNAVAADEALQAAVRERAGLGLHTVLTPHPLEAARLLGTTAGDVQADRLRSARKLADELACVVVLKGSGTVIAAPGRTPVINPTGNARLATGGTGDVLAGLIAARLAGGVTAFDAAAAAVHQHGRVADEWGKASALTAGGLARRLAP